MPGADQGRLLVVDDNSGLLGEIAHVANRAGFEVQATSSAFRFKELFQAFQPTVLVIDISMPDEDGIELIRWLGKQGSSARLVVMNESHPVFAKCAVLLAKEAGLGPVTVLPKPFGSAALLRALQ